MTMFCTQQFIMHRKRQECESWTHGGLNSVGYGETVFDRILEERTNLSEYSAEHTRICIRVLTCIISITISKSFGQNSEACNREISIRLQFARIMAGRLFLILASVPLAGLQHRPSLLSQPGNSKNYLAHPPVLVPKQSTTKWRSSQRPLACLAASSICSPSLESTSHSNLVGIRTEACRTANLH
jgi:hypothetical protein